MAISLETLALASSMKGGSGGGGGSALPSVRGSDNGKVLTVKAGRWQAVKPEKELPQASADYNGKILGIVNGAWSMIDIPVAEDELPAVTSEDDGKILGIVNGAWSMIDIPVAEDELPAVTSEDDGKVMVAVGGEWVNEELLTVGTEHVILPETEGIILQNQYNLDLTAFPSVLLSDLQYIAVHNGRRYELGTAQTPEGYAAVYPPDFDFTQFSDDNMPEIAILLMQGDSASVCVPAILPEDTSHTLTLIAKPKILVKNEHIPFAIKAGSGICSIAEGYMTTASSIGSHAEGGATTASGIMSHAEGVQTTASGAYSHAEGWNTTASGMASHAEGYGTTAYGYASHAEGDSTIANHKAQHVFGEYNVADTSTAAATARGMYIEIVGNGTSDRAKSNARTLDWSGNEVLAGKLTVGAAPTADMDVATKRYVDNKALPSVTTSDNGKVLSVVNGTWSAATASGGGGGVSAIAAGTGTNSVISGSVTGTGANTASGDNSIAAGVATIASHKSQVVFGA